MSHDADPTTGPDTPAPDSSAVRGPTARSAHTAARQRLADQTAAAARTERQRRGLFRGVVVAVVLLLVAGVAVIVNLGRAAEQERSASPAHLVDGGILVGEADVTLTVYEDFLCPPCGSFASENRGQIEAWVADGTVQVDYRPVAILDRLSPDLYPTRALAAAGAVVDRSPEAYPDFHAALFAAQPQQGAPGLTDGQLSDLAVGAGASQDVRALIGSGRFLDWAAATTARSSQAGVVGTPTVLVDGVQLQDTSATGLRVAVAAAG